MFDLTGKTALVTGAGQSVGAGIAQALAVQGAHVLVNDVIEERAQSTVDEINAESGTATPLVFDVTDRVAVTHAFQVSGHIDIVVNNAGNAGTEKMRPTPFADMDPADWDPPIAVNLYGILHTAHAALPNMIASGWGRIITISSGAANSGVNIGVAPYAAAKSAGQAFMRTIAAENARTGVTCNAIALGLMDNTAGGDHTASLAKTIPVGRLGTPHDVAATCVYLTSEESAWVTGQTFHVNGGTLMA